MFRLLTIISNVSKAKEDLHVIASGDKNATHSAPLAESMVHVLHTPVYICVSIQCPLKMRFNLADSSGVQYPILNILILIFTTNKCKGTNDLLIICNFSVPESVLTFEGLLMMYSVIYLHILVFLRHFADTSDVMSNNPNTRSNE